MPDDDDTRDGAETGARDGGDPGAGADAGGGRDGDAGGAGPPDGGDRDPDGGGEGDGDGGGDDYTPPSKAEWARVQAALGDANKEAKKFRLELREFRRQQQEEKRKGETEREAEVREAREKAAADAEARYKPLLVRVAARDALIDAGAVLADAAGKPSASRLNRILRLLDLAELEVADDGRVSGLDAQVQQVKKDAPEFFAERKPPARPRADAADRPPEPKKPRSSAERLAATLPGGG